MRYIATKLQHIATCIGSSEATYSIIQCKPDHSNWAYLCTM